MEMQRQYSPFSRYGTFFLGLSLAICWAVLLLAIPLVRDAFERGGVFDLTIIGSTIMFGFPTVTHSHRIMARLGLHPAEHVSFMKI